MLPTSSIAHQLEHMNPELRDIVLELRNLVAEVTPFAAETFHSRGFSYFDDRRGGTVSAGICQVIIMEDHVRLAFIHGAFLPDPKGLLLGDAKYKKYIRINHYEDAPWEYLKDIIAASADFDPRAITLSE